VKVVKQRKDGVVQRYSRSVDAHELINARNDLDWRQKEALHEIADTMRSGFGSDASYFEDWVDRVKRGPASAWVYSDNTRRAALVRAGYVPTPDEALEWDYGKNLDRYGVSKADLSVKRRELEESLNQQVASALASEGGRS